MRKQTMERNSGVEQVYLSKKKAHLDHVNNYASYLKKVQQECEERAKKKLEQTDDHHKMMIQMEREEQELVG